MRKKDDFQLLDDVLANKKKADADWDRYISFCIQMGNVDKEILLAYIDMCNRFEREYQGRLSTKHEREMVLDGYRQVY